MIKGLQKTLNLLKSADMQSGAYIGTKKETASRSIGRVKELKINGKQSTNDFRIIGGNINTFPVTKYISSDIKKDKLRQIICDTEVDIVTINEHNLNISKIPVEQRPKNTVQGWRKKIISKFGCLESGNDIYGLGGTGILSLDRAATMLIQQQNDKRGLGRWTICSYKCTNNKVITVISCY